jgi:hypothetical protein
VLLARRDGQDSFEREDKEGAEDLILHIVALELEQVASFALLPLFPVILSVLLIFILFLSSIFFFSNNFPMKMYFFLGSTCFSGTSSGFFFGPSAETKGEWNKHASKT